MINGCGNNYSTIAAFAANVLKHDTSGHDFSHIKRVVQTAGRILETEPTADRFIVIAAAYLHDTYDEKLFDDQAAAKAKVVKFLTSINVTKDDQRAIFTIIDNMSWSKSLTSTAKPLDINGQIVQDADRLDAIGAIAIARVFVYGGHVGSKMYDPSIKPRTNISKEAYRNQDESTMINHFYEKLLRLVDYLNTDYAKQIGQKRQQIMLNYLNDFKREWDGMDL
ncbi:HD domain-containing protein [Weissella fabalis]|uniref:HD domain-containing protein n=2 Tax=Periweissella fabalis TaxID=1070421 RepID=A0A7X6N2D5_9LACO|nr:HD domain-containing protein [Periweissella fabalis]NKZ23835.1 HD domain-containing protein [Periweissella fabalis]